ncbi:Protein TIPIN homolog [Eumeta japonica]|uniref:TIMELESS-interacting protein n=1 Tax=Eumeta variegata TaxID=151549 RepID=A0A4C1WXD0_EUMVA|nr:Protein TIPIN homolog [Eumeta japonica]
MSLLEDVFLEDETEEARALERIIEGEESEDLQDKSDEDPNSAEEAEEDKRRIDPSEKKTKKYVKNPRFVLNPALLTGPRGIKVIPEHFKDFKFKGKGHEKRDLDIVLKRLEHWAYRLYPKFQFQDCLKKIEVLGNKASVMVHLHKIRSDQILSDEQVLQKESSDEESNMPVEDEFDKLLQEQIDIARSTQKTKKPEIDKGSTSSPLPVSQQATTSPTMSNEQRERMMRNRQLALERRLARMKQNNDAFNQSQNKSTENNGSRNENENNSGNAQNLNTILDKNGHTDDHRILNQEEGVTICNKILLQDIDYQGNSSQRYSTFIPYEPSKQALPYGGQGCRRLAVAIVDFR